MIDLSGITTKVVGSPISHTDVNLIVSALKELQESGGGSGASTTDASKLTSGKLDDARLSSKVPLLEVVGQKDVIKKANLRNVILGEGIKEFTDANNESSLEVDQTWLDAYASAKGWGAGGVGTTPTLSVTTLTANVVSASQINLSWINVTGATNWILQRATDLSFSDATTIYSGTNLSFSDNGLLGGTMYRYRIRSTGQGYVDSGWSGTSATTQVAGAINPAAHTGFIVNDTDNTGDWSANPNYPALADTEITLDGGLTFSTATVKPMNIGNLSKAPGQVGVRVKSATGRNASPWLFNSAAYTISGGAPYTIEQTVRINFTSEYATNLPDEAPYWNNLNATNASVQAINGFISPVLVNQANASSGITIKNSGSFGGAIGEISAAHSGMDGLFPNLVVNNAWSLNGGSSAKLLLSGLKPDKFYQIYAIMPVNTVPSTRGLSIGGVAVNKVATTVLASFGTIGGNLNDSELITYNNFTGSSVEILVKRVSGDYAAYISAMIIEETNVNKI